MSCCGGVPLSCSGRIPLRSGDCEKKKAPHWAGLKNQRPARPLARPLGEQKCKKNITPKGLRGKTLGPKNRQVRRRSSRKPSARLSNAKKRSKRLLRKPEKKQGLSASLSKTIMWKLLSASRRTCSASTAKSSTPRAISGDTLTRIG